MRDPSGAVSAALITLLRNSAAIRAVTGGIPALPPDAAQPTKAKVFDAVPGTLARPYVNLGKPQLVPVRAQCLAAGDVAIGVHGWTSGPSSVKSKELGDAIVSAIDGANLQVTGFRVLYCEVEGVQYLDDPDPLNQHVVVDLNVQTEPA